MAESDRCGVCGHSNAEHDRHDWCRWCGRDCFGVAEAMANRYLLQARASTDG